MGGPRVLFAGGDHQHVAGGTARVQQQVDGLLGGVERALGRGRDQLDLRGRRSRSGGGGGGRTRRSGLGHGHVARRALRRRRGPRGPGTAGTRRSRGAGTGYGARGRRGAAAGRSGAGTLGTLVNLRLLGNERHELISIKRWCGSRRRVAHACERNRQKSKPSWPSISGTLPSAQTADLLEVPPLGQRIKIRPRQPVVRGGPPLLQRGLVHGRRIPGVVRKTEVCMVDTQFGHHFVALHLGDHRSRRDRHAGLVTLDHRTDPPGRPEIVVLAVEDHGVGTDRQGLQGATAASRSAAVIPRSSISSGEACPRA